MEEFDEDYKRIIYEILRKAGFSECILEKNENSSNGLNFTSSITELSFTFGKHVEKIVVKRGCTSKALCKNFALRTCYETEDHMYSNVFPAFHQFQEVRGTELYPHVARYFGASLESVPEVFVLENLKSLGFLTHPPMNLFDGKHTELVFKELAGYHAANFAMREHNPDGWDALKISLLKQINYFYRNEELRDLFKSRLQKLEMAYIHNDKHDLAQHLNNFIKNFNYYMEKFLEIDSYSIIYHGDLWGCNTMFKYGDKQKPECPTEVRLLDWQASRLGHLCIDLTYFIYLSASPEVLENLSHFMKLYYEHLSLCLREFGVDPEKTFPYSAFEEQWKICSAYSLGLISSIFCGIYLEPNELPDFATIAESGGSVFVSVDFNFRNTNESNKRLMHLFEIMVQNNCFN